MKESNYNNDAEFPIGELLESTSIIFYHRDTREGSPLFLITPNVKEILGFEQYEFETHHELWFDRIHLLIVSEYSRHMKD